MTKYLWPRAIRNVSPGEGFTRIHTTGLDGLPEGAHTGGVWLSPDGKEVWKPLDGGNAHDGDHESTLEDVCLGVMVGEVGFPHNWRVEVGAPFYAPGPLSVPKEWKNCKDTGWQLGDKHCYYRRWLVRPCCLVVGSDMPFSELESETWETVEAAVRALNARGWELGDSLALAYDKNVPHNPYFILDLSCAHPTYYENSAWDDEWRFNTWLTQAGYDDVRKFREAGKRLITSLVFAKENDIPFSWKWAYACRHRPFPQEYELGRPARTVPGSWEEDKVYTWIVCDGPLSDDVVAGFGLTLAWHPWDTPTRRKADE